MSQEDKTPAPTDAAPPPPTTPPAPTRAAVRTLAVCGLAAISEIALALALAGARPGPPVGAGVGPPVRPDVASLLFLAGPPAFLALIAWRRRAHPARSRTLFRLAVCVCGGGLVVIGALYARVLVVPPVRIGPVLAPDLAPRLVPLVQWVVVLVVWLFISRAETSEKRAARSPGAEI